MDTLDAKEMLIRLMDEVRDLKAEQIKHHTFAEAKLESIEKQALKTNGRVTSNEDNIKLLQKDVSSAKTIFYTLSTILSVLWAFITFVFK